MLPPSTIRKTEAFVMDLIKLTVVEVMFRAVELIQIGSILSVVIIVLVVYRHRQRLFHNPQRERKSWH